MSQKQTSTRRDFLKKSGMVAAGVGLAGNLSIARAANAAGDDLIQIALVGCGGRGRGAIMDRLQVKDNVKVVSVADAFEGAAKGAADMLRSEGESGDYEGKIDLPADRVFGGFDGYKKAIDCLKPGDQVVIATTPGFRPFHYRYAIDKGLHVFMEKPLFTDAPGFRHVQETNRRADEKNLKVCVGLQRHYEPQYINWMKQIHEGAIGDVTYSRVYWNGGGIWCKPREKNETEMEYQMRNWYHFVWLCGDNICEQHVHNLDIGLWAHGKGDKMFHPVSANAQGGRQCKAGPESLLRSAPPYSDKAEWWKWYSANKDAFFRLGQAWDHFFVEYTFEDGTNMFSQCRHIRNCWDSVTEFVHGTKGFGGPGWLNDYKGKNIWNNTEKAVKGPYQWEHDVLVDSIRNDKPHNDGWFAAASTMTAVLGRMAAFSGKVLDWDTAVAEGCRYMPEGGPGSWDENPPVMPDEDGFYESSVAQQGVFDPFTGSNGGGGGTSRRRRRS